LTALRKDSLGAVIDYANFELISGFGVSISTLGQPPCDGHNAVADFLMSGLLYLPSGRVEILNVSLISALAVPPMAVILLSYFSTMVTAFVALMFLLTNVFGSVSVHQARHEPHHMSAAARAMALEHYAAADVKRAEIDQTQVAASSPAAPQKASAGSDRVLRTAAKQTQKVKVARLAHDEQRTERLAEGQQGQGYSTLAMGYAPDSREQLAASRIFNTIGSIRTSR
jgi:hypothetical protein